MAVFTAVWNGERGGWTIVERTPEADRHVCRAADRDVAVAQCALLNRLHAYR